MAFNITQESLAFRTNKMKCSVHPQYPHYSSLLWWSDLEKGMWLLLCNCLQTHPPPQRLYSAEINFSKEKQKSCNPSGKAIGFHKEHQSDPSPLLDYIPSEDHNYSDLSLMTGADIFLILKDFVNSFRFYNNNQAKKRTGVKCHTTEKITAKEVK